MTIGHLVECIFAKLCCIDGVLGDASVFIPIEKETIYSRLKEKSFNKYGNEILYNGYTGAQINTEIFIGPTYYFRLKHMVAEKINSRGVGKVMGLTRQPTEGRRKGGGLRIGEMERDTVLSHGISNFIKESMMERSDKFSWCICKRCGTLVAFNMKENINLCRNCNNDDVAVIHTPYAFKLFIQELETMGIQPRLNTEFIDMPIDQAELVRISNAGGGSGDDDGEADDNGDDDIGDDRDNANADTSEAIDYALFNSQIDNFATKNTIIDEKVWKDTYDNNFDKIKGGGMYEDYEEDVEDDVEDEEDDMDNNEDDDEDDEADEDERIQEGGDDDDEDSSSSSIYEFEESVGGDSGDSDDSGGEEIWNDDTDPKAEVEADDKATVEANNKEIKGGDNSDIKELFIEM
jgi:hypothetical protein